MIGIESTAGAGNIPIGVDPADGRSQSRGHGAPSNQAHPSGNLGTNRAQPLPLQITPPNASPLAEFTWCLAEWQNYLTLRGFAGSVQTSGQQRCGPLLAWELGARRSALTPRLVPSFAIR